MDGQTNALFAMGGLLIAMVALPLLNVFSDILVIVFILAGMVAAGFIMMMAEGKLPW